MNQQQSHRGSSAQGVMLSDLAVLSAHMASFTDFQSLISFNQSSIGKETAELYQIDTTSNKQAESET